ncbi:MULTISPECIES: GNAT family N-acetyltransferase [unclassified Guyparkeria]|uniref:GNAT family N-acetyltransferase n=1 Tax=unclassified Guyparkeria TaxID=2626246 RepID=UPI0018D24E1B|nr:MULTISPECIES: GNAT family N-acetyltransferase [unclassified Guyparkeria]
MPAADVDLATIAALAERIWWQVYPPIIGAAQVHYMLGRGYALPSLRSAREAGTRFSLLYLGPYPAGFSAWQGGVDAAFIDKLYLLPALHGCGLGRWLIEATCRQIAIAGHDVARLRVNRHNRAAIRAYGRAGFSIIASDCLPIGGGYVMDDYIMERTALNALLLD